MEYTTLQLPAEMGLWKMKLLKRYCKSDQFSNIHSLDCAVTIDVANNVARLRASTAKKVQEDAHLFLLELVNNFDSARCFLGSDLVEILISASGKAWLKKLLQKKQLTAVLEQFDNGLIVYGVNTLTAEHVVQLISESTGTVTIRTDDSHLQFLNSPEWFRIVAKLHSDSNYLVDIKRDSLAVIVVGCLEEVKVAVIALNHALGINSLSRLSIELDVKILQLLKTHHARDISKEVGRSIEREDGKAVAVEFTEDGLILSGPADALSIAKDVVRTKFQDVIIKKTKAVNHPGLSADVFGEHGIGNAIILQLEKTYRCAIGEVSLSSAKFVSKCDTPSSDDLCFAGDTESSIKVIHRSLTEAKADVLVNPVIGALNDLQEVGIVGKLLSEKGGPSLRQEYSSIRAPRVFGRDLVKTGVGRMKNSRSIYHAAIGENRNNNSSKMMLDCIQLCLEEAKRDGYKSIAFPTLGCGNLKYVPSVVADCFIKAAQHVNGLQILICAFEEKLYEEFTEHCRVNQIARGPRWSANHNLPDSQKTRFESVTVVIYALDVDTIKRVEDLFEEDIQALASGACATSLVEKVKGGVKEPVIVGEGKEEKKCPDLQLIKKTRGVSAYLNAIAAVPFHCPKYWSGVTRKSESHEHFLPTFCVQLDSKSKIYGAVSDLLHSTWKSKFVGQGADAVNLGALNYTKISVRAIWCVENVELYRKYRAKVSLMCIDAAKRRYPIVNGLRGQKEIKTRKLGSQTLEKTLVPEVNEYFLFHGTKKKYINVMVQQGPDPRLAKGTYLGKGVYFAESSTKSDQYADPKNARTQIRMPLYMFLFRVALGDVYVTTGPMDLCRPPCKQVRCRHKDECLEHAELFDSVLGDTRHTGQSLLFREFVVYERNQCFPEYLVEYVRLP